MTEDDSCRRLTEGVMVNNGYGMGIIVNSE